MDTWYELVPNLGGYTVVQIMEDDVRERVANPVCFTLSELFAHMIVDGLNEKFADAGGLYIA